MNIPPCIIWEFQTHSVNDIAYMILTEFFWNEKLHCGDVVNTPYSPDFCWCCDCWLLIGVIYGVVSSLICFISCGVLLYINLLVQIYIFSLHSVVLIEIYTLSTQFFDKIQLSFFLSSIIIASTLFSSRI